MVDKLGREELIRRLRAEADEPRYCAGDGFDWCEVDANLLRQAADMLTTPANGEQVERDDIVTRTPAEDARERVKVLEKALRDILAADDAGETWGAAAMRARTALGNKETDRHG